MTDPKRDDETTGPGTGLPPRPPAPLDADRPTEAWYAPAPDPRPDASWAWGGQQAPRPTAGFAGSRSEPAAAAVPAAPVGAPRRGAGPLAIVAASLLSAVVASAGTVAVLDRMGALGGTTIVSGEGDGRPGSLTSVTIDESSAVIDSAAAVGPAVVKITVAGSTEDPFGAVPAEGVGSGFVYDAAGWILTNRHVVASADSLVVELRDGRRFEGRVYGIDTLTDLAIVKIDADDLPVARLGRSAELEIGQLVVAIGSPLGTYSFSVTSGIVSGTGRDIQVTDGTRITNLIQTDAAINPGNSGGPLADATGAVVGINTAVASDSSGIGFAIPIDIARPIMEQALRGEALARPWIGIRFETIDLQRQEELGLPVAAGALISSGNGNDAVVPGSPAAAAGLRDGDIILSIGGVRIDREHPLDALLVQYAPGETVALEVLRDGTSIVLNVTLGTRPANL